MKQLWIMGIVMVLGWTSQSYGGSDIEAQAEALHIKLDLLVFEMSQDYLPDADYYKMLAKKGMLNITQLNCAIAGGKEDEYRKISGKEPPSHVRVTIYRSCPIMMNKAAQDLHMEIERAIADHDVEELESIRNRIKAFEIDCELCLGSEP
jgi:hypothetical protein